MMKRRYRVFLDTSDIFAAVLSETGGARKLFRLGEANVIDLVMGLNVLRESEEVIKRKVPSSLPILAYLLDLGLVETASGASEKLIEIAMAIVGYRPDSYVLAEAFGAEPDWFVTHDKEHFINVRQDPRLPFIIGTPGDFLRALSDEFSLAE